MAMGIAPVSNIALAAGCAHRCKECLGDISSSIEHN